MFPENYREILSNRVSGVGGLLSLKKTRIWWYATGEDYRVPYASLSLKTTITLITLVFTVAQGRIKRLPFQKSFAKTALLFSSWCLGVFLLEFQNQT